MSGETAPPVEGMVNSMDHARDGGDAVDARVTADRDTNPRAADSPAADPQGADSQGADARAVAARAVGPRAVGPPSDAPPDGEPDPANGIEPTFDDDAAAADGDGAEADGDGAEADGDGADGFAVAAEFDLDAGPDAGVVLPFRPVTVGEQSAPGSGPVTGGPGPGANAGVVWGGGQLAGPAGQGFGLVGAPTGRRVRARLARFNAPWQTPSVNEALEPLIGNHRASHPKADTRILQRAYGTAETWHNGQYRKSGDPYITHPLAVAGILAELGMDTTTLVAALLHDTIEDTGYTLDQMRDDFGGEVALLVDGVTKLDRVKLGDSAKAETIRKMVVAMAKDPRVLVIKLADRLHNMRTLTFLPSVKQEQKAKETLEILAPLAHRLGMNTIKWELEDLAFKTLFPKRFDEINRLIGDHAPQREALLRQVTQKVAI
ncbi:MAG: diphosphokinase / guanosine-3,5-bis(diphosphate) 3-diphosphatase, partial [Micromonosporaceae bacterium]|nr:diphosphokinase / guanosine-3,5-bis(diphosphate) 3-diphosphatase [Micromonosporaceae bacterium]